MTLAETVIRGHEGLRFRPYKDSFGNITIGIGRNLTDRGISPSEAEVLFSNDMTQAVSDARSVFPLLDSYTEARQAALIDMAFNLGRSRLKTFHKMIAAIGDDDWERASAEALDSEWVNQVGKRAINDAKMLRTGEL